MHYSFCMPRLSSIRMNPFLLFDLAWQIHRSLLHPSSQSASTVLNRLRVTSMFNVAQNQVCADLSIVLRVISVVVVDVESLGLSQALFDDWLRVNDKLLQEDEHSCGIDELLCLYVETLDSDTDISDSFKPEYYDQITRVHADGNMNSHGVCLKQLLYEAIRDCMFSIPSFTPLQTKLNTWTHQEYPTYGGVCRSIDTLLLNTPPWEAARNSNLRLIPANRTNAEDFYVFFHGCTEQGGLSILRNGIGLHWNNPKGTDFGPGMYVTKNILDAMYVAQRRSQSRYLPPNRQVIGNRSCCIVFHCPKTEYDPFRKLDLSLASFDPPVER